MMILYACHSPRHVDTHHKNGAQEKMLLPNEPRKLLKANTSFRKKGPSNPRNPSPGAADRFLWRNALWSPRAQSQRRTCRVPKASRSHGNVGPGFLACRRLLGGAWVQVRNAAALLNAVTEPRRAKHGGSPKGPALRLTSLKVIASINLPPSTTTANTVRMTAASRAN
jgi:hypothetical protein